MSEPRPVPSVLELLERGKELDHAHLTRARPPGGGVGLALSLRYLRTVVRGLLAPTKSTKAVRMAPPPVGSLAIGMVGHASVLIASTQARVLTDPCLVDQLWGLRRRSSAALDREDAAEVSLVLVSHAHLDHLHLPSLKTLPRAATVVVPSGCVDLVAPLGFADVVGVEPGDEVVHRDLRITAVAANHDGRRSLFDPRWRGACGYVIAAPGIGVYFAGDTGYFSGFGDIGRRFRPDVALLPIAGYEPLALRGGHLSPLDAIAAFEELGADVLIPIAHGAFPLGYEPLEAPLSWLRALCEERGLGAKVSALMPGQVSLVRRRGLVAA